MHASRKALAASFHQQQRLLHQLIKSSTTWSKTTTRAIGCHHRLSTLHRRLRCFTAALRCAATNERSAPSWGEKGLQTPAKRARSLEKYTQDTNPHFHTVQQMRRALSTPTSQTRTYFYSVDLRGRLFLDGERPFSQHHATRKQPVRTEAAALRDPRFLDFFFTRLTTLDDL